MVAGLSPCASIEQACSGGRGRAKSDLPADVECFQLSSSAVGDGNVYCVNRHFFRRYALIIDICTHMRVKPLLSAGACALSVIACSVAPEILVDGVAEHSIRSQIDGVDLTARQSAARPGGESATHGVHNQQAFARPAPTASAADLRQFNFGNRLFNTKWVIAPASVAAFDGLGPVFNRVSCSGCHVRDGRGRPPIGDESSMLSMLIRWSLPSVAVNGEPLAIPGYGTQLNDRAIPGVPAEAGVVITWSEQLGRYADGIGFVLRSPRYRFSNPAFGPLPEAMAVSGRVAPAVFGLGLIEAIPDASIVASADPNDEDGDGISGRPNWVGKSALGESTLGRFGWKAGVGSLPQQAADAARNDIGITTTLSPTENCQPRQVECASAAHGGSPEMDDRSFDRLVKYLRLIGVPSRRATQDDVMLAKGESLFLDMGCADCHRPSWVTGADAAIDLLSLQTIFPYSDFLLHDMGPGLADNRPEFVASGREWRTPPLWGVGLILTVNNHQFLLHDGRARGVAEAVLWHGGEAEPAMRQFKAALNDQRDALVAFVNSL